MTNAANGNESAEVLQVARRNNGESNVCGFRDFLEALQCLDDQICGGWIYDLVEDAEVDGGNFLVAGASRISLHDLAEDVLHNFVEVVLVECVCERFVALLNIISQIGELR